MVIQLRVMEMINTRFLCFLNFFLRKRGGRGDGGGGGVFGRRRGVLFKCVCMCGVLFFELMMVVLRCL